MQEILFALATCFAIPFRNFVPFVELQISAAKVARVVAPLSRALRAAWSSPAADASF